VVTVRMPRYPYDLNSPAAWEAYWWEVNYGHSGHRGYFTVPGIIAWVHDQLDPMKNLIGSHMKLGEDQAHAEAKVLIERVVLDRATRITWLLDEVDARTRMNRWAYVFIDAMGAMCRSVCGEDHESSCAEERAEWEVEFENKGLKQLSRVGFGTMTANRRLAELKPVLTSLYDAQSQVVHGKTLEYDDGLTFPTDARTASLLIEIAGSLVLSYVSPQG